MDTTVRTNRRVDGAPKRVKETAEYGAFARRIIAGYRRRVGTAADLGSLKGLVDLRAELDAAITAAGRDLVGAGYTYTDLADTLGVTRSAAYQRFGGK